MAFSCCSLLLPVASGQDPPCLLIRALPLPTLRYHGATQIEVVQLVGGEGVPAGNGEVHEAEDSSHPHVQLRAAARGRRSLLQNKIFQLRVVRSRRRLPCVWAPMTTAGHLSNFSSVPVY